MDELAQKIEKTKILYDFLKHLATLSTASIILMATWLGRLVTPPKWRVLIVISFVGFVISLIGIVQAQYACIDRWHGLDKGGDATKYVFRAVKMAIAGFFVGLISIVLFAVKNL